MVVSILFSTIPVEPNMVYWGCIGILEKKTETTVQGPGGLGFRA